MQIIFEGYQWLVKYDDGSFNCLPDYLLAEVDKYMDAAGEEHTEYFYPLYFPVGQLIKFCQENGLELEIIY